jgi:hypothetical protein
MTRHLLKQAVLRSTILATLATALYLSGCHSTASAGAEYLGLWQHVSEPALTLSITRQGDQFLVHKMVQGRNIPTNPDRIGSLRNGLLQFDDVPGSFYQYHPDTQTITSSGNSEFVYRRKQ